MNTLTIWLLISIGNANYAGSPHIVIERFVTAQECERVAALLRGRYNAPVQCIQATVLAR